jgi:hypothetical protein
VKSEVKIKLQYTTSDHHKVSTTSKNLRQGHKQSYHAVEEIKFLLAPKFTQLKTTT